MRNVSLAAMVATGCFMGTANAQIATDQDGQWFPGAVWVGDIPPTSVDVAELGHAISLDTGIASGSSVSISGLDFLAPGSLSISNQIALDLTGASSWNVGSNLNLDNATTLTLGGSVLLTDNTAPRLHIGTGTGQLIVPVGVTLDGRAGGGITAAVTAQLNYPGSMFQWQGGEMIDGTIENIGQINLVGSDDKTISGRLRNSALMRHDGSGNLLLNNQALENEVGAVYDIVSNAGLVNDGSGLMINRGTLRKSGGSGDSVVSVRVNGLDGHRLEVSDGSLQFSGIALFDSTSYEVMAPATVEFLSGSTLRLSSTNSTMPPTAHTGSGDGQIRMLAGSTIDAITGGGRLGVTAQLNFPGDMFQWEGGRLVDGTVENLGQMNLSGIEQKEISGILLNSADMVQSGSGDLGLSNTALTNGPNGVYDMRSDSGIVNLGSGTMINQGLIVKSAGAGTSTIDVTLTGGSGHTVRVQSGILALAGDSDFDSTLYDINPGSTLQFPTGSRLTLTTDNSVTTPKVHSGTGGGTIVMETGSTLDAVNGGGTFGVTSQLDFPGDMFQWEGGRLVDGTVENIGQMNLSGSGQKDITGVLLNSADMVQSGTGNLGLDNTALTNGPNGVYDMRSDSGIANLGSGTMINQGLIVKSAGAGTSTIDVTLTGASGHTVSVQSGTLSLAGESNFDSTLYDISPGATLRFPMDSRLTLSTDNLESSPKVHSGTGGGTIVMETGSTLDAVNGGGTFGVTSQLDFPGEMFQWEGGVLVDGTAENIGQINLAGGDTKTITGLLQNSGLIRHIQGALDIDGLGLVNDLDGTYDIAGDVLIDNAGSGRMINRGRIVKTAGLGQAVINLNMDSESAAIDVQSGSMGLSAENRFVDSTYTVASGASLDFLSGSVWQLTISNSQDPPSMHQGFGSGRVNVLPGALIDGVSGGGVLGVTSQLNFPADMLHWRGGSLRDGTVENVGQMTLSDVATKSITGRLRNSGLIIQQDSGELSITNLGLINAAGGTYEIRSDAGFANGGSGRITNSGTLRKMVASGTSLIAPALDNAGGLVVAQSGVLDLQGDVNFSAGIFQVLNNATINFNQMLDVPPEGRLAGQGTLVAPTFDVDGAIEPGEGIGALSMTGDVNLNPESNLFLEIGGLSNNDQLNVSGLIATDGVVTVNFVNGFAPANGDQFTLITSTANSSSITVDSFVINGLAPGASFDVIDAGGSVILEALADAAPGEELTTVPPPQPLLAGDGFGSAVDVDGNLLVVGLPGMNDGAGAVAVYDVVGGQAVLNVLLPVPPGFSATGFGAALAVSGDTIVVGTDGVAPPTQKIASAIAAAIYRRTQAGGYEFKQPLTAPQTSAGDGFGSSVAISGDNVVVGAPDDGEDETTPSGAAYLFNRNVASGGFMPRNKLKPQTPNLAARFGQAVAIRGGTLAVGAPMDKPGPTNTTGSASIYDIVAGAVTRVATTSGSGTNDGAQFGASLDVDSDGTVLVGAPMEGNGSTRSGAVYILGRQGEVFRETDRLTPMEPQDGGEFGRSVAIDQTGIFIGAPKSAADLIAAGIVHRFGRMSKTETGTLRGKSGQLGFGTSVSVSGDKVAIGAPNTARFAGAASLLLDGDRIFRGGFE